MLVVILLVTLLPTHMSVVLLLMLLLQVVIIIIHGKLDIQQLLVLQVVVTMYIRLFLPLLTQL